MSRWMVVVLLALRAFSTPTLVASDSDKDRIQHVVIEPATMDAPRSDTASIAQLPDDQIMVVYHKYESGEHTPLTCARSTDQGRTWRIIGNIASDPNAEYTNLDCFFTPEGDAILTYMYAKPAWNRQQIHLNAALIPRRWFDDH